MPIGKNTFLIAALLVGSYMLACGGSDADSLSDPLPGSGGASGGACKTSVDCGGTTPVCDELASVCVQCLFATHCPSGSECVDRACVAQTPCTSSLDCVGSAPTTICDIASGVCVQCVEAVDCGGTADCIDRQCVPYQPCTTSLDCSLGLVCDPAAARCVECVTYADCADGDVCVGNKCETRIPCTSDNQCTPMGKLCDKALGYCVDCLNNDQCPSAYHCAGGACALDECQPGASKCDDNQLVTCLPTGDFWGAPQPCPDRTACTSSSGTATCQPWVCEPGLTYCEGDTLIACAPDGSSVISSVDCTAQGQHCGEGICRDQVCTPSARYCEGAQVRECNADGTDATLIRTCTAQQFCDPSTATCVALLCTPNQPVCDGNIATVCNAAGTGYLPGGPNCAAQGKSCVAGACVGCAPGGVEPTEVRLTEVFMGTNDYVVLTNRGACPAQLDALTVRFRSNDSVNNLDFNVPHWLLDAGASVYIRDANGAEPGDISSTENIFLTPGTGEYVMLCNGPCSTGTAVIDYFAHASGAQPPTAPFGITFAPAPLTGITSTTEDTQAYLRNAYAGSFPAFRASDWSLGAASRPGQNTNQCPVSQPADQTLCGMNPLSCVYGSVTCICMLFWSCQ